MEQGTGNLEQGFKNLEAWRKGDDLASSIFRLTEDVLDQRHRWLGLQIVRAAFSVTSNIAEGYGRSSLGDYIRFLEIAGASLNEVENALHFIRRNNIVPSDEIEPIEKLRWVSANLLFGLIKSLRTKLANKGEWQRGLLREEPVEYGIADASLSMFQVPSSKFQSSEDSNA